MRQYNLDPTTFIERLLNCFNNPTTDVEIRRLISALFFSVFNYWIEKTGCSNADPIDFVKWVDRNLKSAKYRRDIRILRAARNAVDHYVDTSVKLPYYESPIEIKRETFERVEDAYRQILNELKKI
ncbi:hypothetical protein [Acidianus sp. RZ1]|uniref:hypothetical protein n=1 Tax=Acidianus sp. RZ1 TaxID=1540082 RepID=UPI001491DFE5|nr:hypothetical protein [Acidianus sp. RZ1]NON61765.1 hypothetical protein [Acidianus sp. RZ1]